MGRQVEPGGGGVPVAGSGRGRAVCAFVGGKGVSVACGRRRSAVGEVLAFKRHVERRLSRGFIICRRCSDALALVSASSSSSYSQLGVQTPPTRDTKP